MAFHGKLEGNIILTLRFLHGMVKIKLVEYILKEETGNIIKDAFWTLIRNDLFQNMNVVEGLK